MNTNYRSRRMFVNILSIVVMLAMAFPVTGRVSAQDEPPALNPFIAVSLTQNWFWVNNYTPDTLVTFSIYESKGDDVPIFEFSRNTDEFGNVTIEGWEHTWQPKPGNYMVATDGSITKDLVLEYITLDVFDPEKDIVSGYTQAGREVGVGVGNSDGEQWMNPTADDKGLWTANFSTIRFDVTEDMWAGGHIGDEDGDVTAAHNSGPSEPPAWFTAFPEQDAVEAWDFPLGAVVHLAIDDPATPETLDYEQDETVTFTPWGSWQLWIWFDFAGQYDMKAGDIVTLNYGEIVRTHVVRNLAITKVNYEDDTLKGIADAGADVTVWPHATGQQQIGTANPRGRWNVGFSSIYDLMPGDGGRSEIRDESGNATAVDWYIPNPRIVASITEDWFYVYEFPLNTALSISLYESQGGKPLWNGTVTTDEFGFAWLDSDGRWDLEPGNYLLIRNGQNTKDLVIEGFTFDVLNLSHGLLLGTAPEPYGRRVWVGIGWDNETWSKDITTDGTGSWLADFGQPVPDGYGWVAAQLFDADGDASELRPSQIYPTIFAWLEWDQVDGHGWREGETVILTINNGEHEFSQVAGTDKLVFDLGANGHNLTIGDQVTMSDGLITKEILIPDLKITDYDLGAKTVSGTYDPNLGFRTSVNGQSPSDITFAANSWIAKFDNLGPSVWGDAIQRDVDSDEVAATIHAPSPNFYAVPDENRIFAQEWIVGYPLDLKVYDVNGNEVYSTSQMVEPPSEVPWTLVIFDLNTSNIDLLPGHKVVLTQRGYQRELIVHNLQVTNIDLSEPITISGIADPGWIFISVNGTDSWIEVGEAGTWQVSSSEYESGEWGSVIITNEYGDQTRDIFMIPYP